MAWEHLAIVVPEHLTALGVRLVENQGTGIIFVNCVATQDCQNNYESLYNSEYYPADNFVCSGCGRKYYTPVVVSSTLDRTNYTTLDGAYWFSVWLEKPREDIVVTVDETVKL